MIINETLKSIKNRRSVRSFQEAQIKDAELQAILEAGLYAPSAMNQQSCNFTVIQNQSMIEDIGYNAKEAGKKIENEHIQKLANNENYNVFYGAPTVIIISGDEKAVLCEANCAAATENMLIAAESIGLGSCWINVAIFVFDGDKAEQYKQKLGIPVGYKPYYSIALGYKTIESTNALPRKENRVNYVK